MILKTYYVHIGFTRLLDKLVFDEWFVGRGHDPADQVPVFDRGSFNGIVRKSLRFGGVMTPPYEPPSNSNLSLHRAVPIGALHIIDNHGVLP